MPRRSRRCRYDSSPAEGGRPSRGARRHQGQCCGREEKTGLRRRKLGEKQRPARRAQLGKRGVRFFARIDETVQRSWIQYENAGRSPLNKHVMILFLHKEASVCHRKNVSSTRKSNS